ncbi:hypothetical protein DHEL01_v200352 [Diaporthe helianthi]|uniref:Uncharacterized protein n=1 Tax=Diaporthe helianthi TaxID=158607 RepID=A0A2P5IFH2_DIAHE|nr:hypothetical protein DHEL01_v200352 [Diaporthe helianthi]
MPGGGESHGRYFGGTSCWLPVNVTLHGANARTHVLCAPASVSSVRPFAPTPPAEEVMEFWATPMCDHPGPGLGAKLVPPVLVMAWHGMAWHGMSLTVSVHAMSQPSLSMSITPERSPIANLPAPWLVPGLANVKPVPREDDRSPRCPSC